MNLTDDEIRVKCAEAMGVKTTVFRGHLVDAITLCDTIPDYPNDPAAALTLCDRLMEEGCEIGMVNFDGIWRVRVFCDRALPRMTEMADPSLARAICLAFLRVKGGAK